MDTRVFEHFLTELGHLLKQLYRSQQQAEYKASKEADLPRPP